VLFDGKYVIDPARNPAHMDIGVPDAASGIYKFEGDTLVIAHPQAGKLRPAKFDSPPGSGVILAVWKKAKPAG
jgi:uncharacterized protein (TIGR03067 family)